MQDRYYMIGIIVVLAICCLGGYVAISGYLNSNPPSFALSTPGTLASPIVVLVPTDTPGPTKPPATIVGAPTIAPVPSPLGAFQTIAASTTQLPPSPTTGKPPSNPPTVLPTPAAPSCSGFAFCPKGGPPDYNLGVGGDPCRPNYVWGRITDKAGKGIPDVRIRYKLIPTGEVSDAYSKSPPDPAGVYNFPAPPGSTWQFWIVDSGNQASPQVTVTVRPYPGSGDCPTRLDFVQQ